MLDIDKTQIEIVKLSENKIRLDYNAPIICEENELETIKLKIRYKLDPSDGIYKMVYPKEVFLIRISNRLRVKKKFINYGDIFPPTWTGSSFGTNKHFELDGIKFNNFIKSIHISDTKWYKTWNRDNQLNELLK
jgi:hypothetical protein